MPRSVMSMPSETINPPKLSSIAPKQDKSMFSNMAAKSMSELVNMSAIAEMSKPDRLRLANKLDMSKFSSSKLLTNPFNSSLSRLDASNLDVIAVMSKSGLLKMPTSSATLIADRS